MDPQPLARKVAIVTGSASGIGKGIALRFAEEGADVSCWDLNLEGAKETAREVEKAGRKSLALQVDVTKSGEVEDAAKAVFDQFGKIDILVNSAGIIRAHFITEVPEEIWDSIITINLKGTFLCIREIAKYMERQFGIMAMKIR